SFVYVKVTSKRTNWLARAGAGIATAATPPICSRITGRNLVIARIVVLPVSTIVPGAGFHLVKSGQPLGNIEIPREFQLIQVEPGRQEQARHIGQQADVCGS